MIIPEFNPACSITVESIRPGSPLVIVDNALLNPEAFVEYASANAPRFRVDRRNAYPGPEFLLDPASADAAAYFFKHHIRQHFGVSRQLVHTQLRMSLSTQPPNTLVWGQRICHIDEPYELPPHQCSIAGVAYLFHAPELGGTAFYRFRSGISYFHIVSRYEKATPELRQEMEATYPFLSRPPAYLTGSNEFVEFIRDVSPRWNRMVFFRADEPHNPHITHPELLTNEVRRGRLSLNMLFRCYDLAN